MEEPRTDWWASVSRTLWILELKHRPTTDINLVPVLCCIVELVLQFYNFELAYSAKKNVPTFISEQ